MDERLSKRLMDIEEQIDNLRDAEHAFLNLEAHKKVLAAQLFLTAEGKNIPEKESNVYASKAWIQFSLGHVEAESRFNHERRKYELKLKSYDAEHLSLKSEYPVIRRQQ